MPVSFDLSYDTAVKLLRVPDVDRRGAEEIASPPYRKGIVRALITPGLRLRSSCGDVYISPDGSVSVPHSKQYVQAALANEVLGEPVCECVALRRLITSGSLEPRSLRVDDRLQAKLGWLMVYHDVLRRTRRSRSFRGPSSGRTPEETYTRRLVFERLIRDVRRILPRDDPIRYRVTINPYALRSIKGLRGAYTRREMCVSVRGYRIRDWIYGTTPLNVEISLGIDALLRWKRGTWYVSDPKSSHEYLVICEAPWPVPWRGGIYRDCLVLVPDPTATNIRPLIHRALTDPDGRIRAWVGPARWAVSNRRNQTWICTCAPSDMMDHPPVRVVSGPK